MKILHCFNIHQCCSVQNINYTKAFVMPPRHTFLLKITVLIERVYIRFLGAIRVGWDYKKIIFSSSLFCISRCYIAEPFSACFLHNHLWHDESNNQQSNLATLHLLLQQIYAKKADEECHETVVHKTFLVNQSPMCWHRPCRVLWPWRLYVFLVVFN